MTLDAKIKDEETGSLKRHNFILERPLNKDKVRFRKSLYPLAKLGRILKIDPTENAVLDGYQNNPFRLPVSYEEEVPEIIRLGEEYYWSNTPGGF